MSEEAGTNEGKSRGRSFKESKIECSRVNNATRNRTSMSPRKRWKRSALGELPPRNAHEKKRKEEKERRNERKKTAEWRGKDSWRKGDQRFVPGAYTIASPWRNNGSWMSHRVQSQSGISRRGILRGNDRFATAIDLRAAAIRSPLSTNRSDGSPLSPRLFSPPLLTFSLRAIISRSCASCERPPIKRTATVLCRRLPGFASTIGITLEELRVRNGVTEQDARFPQNLRKRSIIAI